VLLATAVKNVIRHKIVLDVMYVTPAKIVTVSVRYVILVVTVVSKKYSKIIYNNKGGSFEKRN
jgi:hypothetical protein